MITFPNAKINLGLSVVAKRTDGYHDLETVFYPIGLTDALEVLPSSIPGCKLYVSGLLVDGASDDNLIVKAYRKLQQHYNLPGVETYLYKKIPFGAGMGGGSSDAAFMLGMLRELLQLPFSDEQWERLSGELGADCPFFCHNVPMYAEGTGNEFAPVNLTLKGYTLVVVKPSFGVSTKEAFSGICPRKPQLHVKQIVEEYPIERWKELLKNDFEQAVFPLYPQLQQIKEILYQQGAVYASMSGSGSALYGIFEKPVELSGFFQDCFVWSGICTQ